MQPKAENYAFIDSQNLNIGVRNDLHDSKGKLIRKGWSLDFELFRNYLRTKYSVTKAFLFIGYVVGNESLYQNLQHQGYILVFKPVLKITNGGKDTYKGNVDAELVLHAMIELNNYQKAVIVSGDGDFHCLIEYLADNQKLLKLITPHRRYSSLIKKYTSYIVTVDTLKSKLELKHRSEKDPKKLSTEAIKK